MDELIEEVELQPHAYDLILSDPSVSFLLLRRLSLCVAKNLA
jgi:hypothetical protein